MFLSYETFGPSLREKFHMHLAVSTREIVQVLQQLAPASWVFELTASTLDSVKGEKEATFLQQACQNLDWLYPNT